MRRRMSHRRESVDDCPLLLISCKDLSLDQSVEDTVVHSNRLFNSSNQSSCCWWTSFLTRPVSLTRSSWEERVGQSCCWSVCLSYFLMSFFMDLSFPWLLQSRLLTSSSCSSRLSSVVDDTVLVVVAKKGPSNIPTDTITKKRSRLCEKKDDSLPSLLSRFFPGIRMHPRLDSIHTEQAESLVFNTRGREYTEKTQKTRGAKYWRKDWRKDWRKGKRWRRRWETRFELRQELKLMMLLFELLLNLDSAQVIQTGH